MSYLTIDIDGEPQEITDIGKVYGRKEYGDKFIEALETRISENREAGRAPLDGIDFPDGSKQHDVSLWSWGSLMMANRLNKSEVFIKALEDQCKGKNDPKEALDFIGKLDLSSVLRESDGVKKDLLKVLYDRTLEEKTKLTASTATWAMAYASKHDLSGNFGYFSEDVTRFEDNGEKLEENAVKALDVVLKGGRGNGLHHMAGVLERSDLSSLDNKAKESIEDVVQSKVKDFTEQSLVTNLSEKAFLKRKNITLEDVQAYYDKDKRLSEIDLLNEIDSAKENNGIENYTEAMNKVRGELAVKYVMETEQVNYSVVNKFSKDICQGFKDNAEALKKLGVAIPSSVMDVLKKDEQLKDDIKFIDESRSFINFDVGQDNKVELLNQVTEKGFSAGYGVELLVLESGKALETNRKTYE